MEVSMYIFLSNFKSTEIKNSQFRSNLLVIFTYNQVFKISFRAYIGLIW